MVAAGARDVIADVTTPPTAPPSAVSAMVDSLQIGAGIIVVFVLALTTEILFACCRVYTWLRRQVGVLTNILLINSRLEMFAIHSTCYSSDTAHWRVILNCRDCYGAVFGALRHIRKTLTYLFTYFIAGYTFAAINKRHEALRIAVARPAVRPLSDRADDLKTRRHAVEMYTSAFGLV